ncbi:MAG: ATP-binding protein [Arcicella sp.]|jgi:hypothetical protein|nr:ATP-binding protein [Arcicella sp.]
MIESIIGRKKEITLMESLKESSKSEFLAVYGRRRVGKTFLIRQVFENDFTFQLTGLANAKLQWQLANFYKALTKQNPHNSNIKPTSNWFDAFHELIYVLELSKAKKKVIFLDELPWLDTPNSGFMTALEHFWNSWASARKDIILIVCGSAASWMINKLLKNKGGLHNRITQRCKLEPFNLAETEAFFKAKNAVLERYQITQLYMTLGGIPYYLDMVDVNMSSYQNINRLFFEEDAPLRIEFESLYESLFKKAQNHIAVIEALSQKVSGMNRDELIKAAKVNNGGGTTTILQELEECGFIRKYNSFGKNQRGNIFQLVDFYSLFYLAFVKKSSVFDETTWINGIDNPAFRAWSGYAFEMICLHHIPKIKEALGISGMQTNTATWYSTDKSQKAQVDLLIERRDGIINLCEIKFSINPFVISKNYAEELRSKIAVFKEQTKTKKTIFLTMITSFGLQKNEYSNQLVQNSLTMDVLFN